MTSGLYDYATDSNFIVQLKANPLKKWTQMELINTAISHPPYFPPGTGWHYSSTNSILTGMIIEQVTGNTLTQEIQNRIITPLNLTNTYFPSDQNMPSGSICNGYSLLSGPASWDKVTTRFDPSWIWASGTMISNSTDLKEWAKALVNGSLLSSEMQKERMKLIYTGTPSVKFGLGIYDLQNGFSGYKGTIPGYNNIIVYFPGRGALIMIMINLYPVDNVTSGYPNMDGFFNSVIKLLYPDMKPNEDIFIVN
jgi:D-alanyl-D-alanine carboxypeptidase